MRNKWLSFASLLVIALMLNASVNAQKNSGNKPARTKSDKTNMQWIEMGPSNQGGRIKTVLIDKNNSNLIYAGAIAGGLWKSTTSVPLGLKLLTTPIILLLAVYTKVQMAIYTLEPENILVIRII
jgi:hypothetical protein